MILRQKGIFIKYLSSPCLFFFFRPLRVTGRPGVVAKLFCSNKNKPIHCVVKKKKKGVAGIGDNAGIKLPLFYYSMRKLSLLFKASATQALCIKAE